MILTAIPTEQLVSTSESLGSKELNNCFDAKHTYKFKNIFLAVSFSFVTLPEF